MCKEKQLLVINHPAWEMITEQDFEQGINSRLIIQEDMDTTV